MPYHFEPMTEKQWQTLHKLIHEAEWPTISRNMSKQEASERIGQAIRQAEYERNEYYRRKFPSPPSLRLRSTRPRMTDEAFEAKRKWFEQRYSETQAKQKELDAAEQLTETQQPTSVTTAPAAEAKPVQPTPPRRPVDLRIPPPSTPKPVEPLTKAQRDELYRILTPMDTSLIDCMTKQEAWLAINQWHKGMYMYLPQHLKPRRRERIFFKC